MNIKIEYEPTAHELAKASSLFAEKKPLLLYTVGLVNIFMAVLFVIFFLKVLFLPTTLQDLLPLGLCAIWLFGRRPFNEWLLYRRMKKSLVIGKPMIIEISRNGIVWSGKGLRQGQMTWDQIKYILEAQNGFVFPNTFTRFLWVPFRGFNTPDDLQNLRDLIVEKQVVLRVYRRWRC
ncbi:MAG: YcxB family protein [Proteobacteria bacterium]|nr:YcxB family protein [Pseudomonadota bacterium]